MAPVAGYNATVSLSGTSTAMTGEACTEVSYVADVGVHQITNAAKRILDPAVAVVVYIEGLEIGETGYALDYFTGRITFVEGAVSEGDTVTVSANFIPVVQVAEARSATINAERDELDTSVLGTVEKSHILGKRGATVEMESLHLLSEDLDPGGGSTVLDAIFDNATPKLVQVYNGAQYFRGWCLLPAAQQAIPADELVTSSLTWKTSLRKAEGRSEFVAFSWGT